ncbi:hypothetical protein MZM54_02680 [[Brevibacterium] frigoritolerans]|nr:hypothetical protein [Peribacillus frigoritolerans]
MNPVPWGTIKSNILRRMKQEYPFVKALGLNAVNMERYVESRGLMENIEGIPYETKLIQAYEHLFKLIGIKIEIEELMDEKPIELLQLNELSYEMVFTFNLDKGIEVMAVGTVLARKERDLLIEYIYNLVHVHNGKENEIIDVFFADVQYLEDKISSLRKSLNVKARVNYLSDKIKNLTYIMDLSEKMKIRYAILIQEEVQKYMLKE